MNQSISKVLIAATFVTFGAAVNVQAEVRSKAIVVESPSDLPELAQGRCDAMYLHHTRAAQAILYLQRDRGRKLAILDVTDPAKIRAVGEVTIDAPSAYDFVQDLSNSGVLIHYRNDSGFEVLGFDDY